MADKSLVVVALPRRRTQEQRIAQSDRRMIQAAVESLVKLGVAGTTLAIIGARSGYSRGLVTHRFGSKAGLLAHLHDEVAARWIGRMRTAVGDAQGIDAMRCVIDALCGFIIESPDELRAMYLLRYASIDPAAEYRANVSKVHRAQCRDVRRWLEAGQALGTVSKSIEAEFTAELFCATVDGILYRWLVNPRVPVRELHRLLSDELTRALAAPRTSARSRDPDR
jgi:AcrR family transcriptional regulator